MRPHKIDEIAGQQKHLAPGKWLRQAIERDRLVSLIFWGPPGVGKTTLAEVIAHATQQRFIPFSAVLGGVSELRKILKEAEEARRYQGQSTILFVDEIHRFNKAQQDAFLPHVEKGTVTLIGATTENPSFAVNAAVLSRAKVFQLEALQPQDLLPILHRALTDPSRGLGHLGISVTDDALQAIAEAAQGDARRALSLLEAAVEVHDATERKETPLKKGDLKELLADRPLLFDKSGDQHYQVISAFIKSMRGSDPDAAIYWLMRMLEAGEDPLFILRRMMIFASEDVGNADPRALQVAVAADQSFQRMGMPEGIYPIAHACIYLASCPKSAAVNRAWHRAQAAVKKYGNLSVPLKLRNAPTSLMKADGYGKDYQYPHDHALGYIPEESYLPEEVESQLQEERFYEPSEFGLEKAIGERLQRLRNTKK
ncbi:MAG: replication-associated recombination protein A [Polyangiaceae bacterium]|nr:replication-associated recombination protein A [Polyangiaceae bacterium]